MASFYIDFYTTMISCFFYNSCLYQIFPKQQLYGHLPLISKTIHVKQTGHAGSCWRCKYELMIDVPLWNPTCGGASIGRPARSKFYISCVRE